LVCSVCVNVRCAHRSFVSFPATMICLQLLCFLVFAIDDATGARRGRFRARGKGQLNWGFSGDINQTALEEFNAWDQEQGWSAKSRPGVNYSDADVWPRMQAPEDGWDLGLNSPRVMVLSMKQRAARRQSFKQQFQGVGWKLGAEWAAALDGASMPSKLRWLKGFEDTKSWDHDKPGNWGCYISHLAMLRDHQAKCSTCDLMIFEDDAVFVPGFEQRWQSFFSKVPKDWSIVRLGGQSLWEPSFEATPDYVHAKAVANTWGYVVRAKEVGRLADLLAGLPVKGNWGVDAVLQLFNTELKTYVPTIPLVQAVGSCSDSSAKTPGHGCKEDDPESLHSRITRLHQRWPQGYFRTYCLRRGEILDVHKDTATEAEGCVNGDLSRDTCCPYKDPPLKAM